MAGLAKPELQRHDCPEWQVWADWADMASWVAQTDANHLLRIAPFFHSVTKVRFPPIVPLKERSRRVARQS